MQNIEDDLNELLNSIWADLENAVADSKNPFRTPALGSVNAANEPSLRTVVLRAVDPKNRTLTCYADFRSTKIEQLQNKATASYLFYDAERKIQLRATGPVTIHHLDEIAKEQWQQTNTANRLAYLTLQAPGTPQNMPDSGLQAELVGRLPTETESEEGWPNFAVILCTIRDFDWVLLSSKGNRRAAFHWDETKRDEIKLEAAWLVP